MKSRVTAFALTIGGMVALIAWTAHSSWRRTGELESTLTSVQLESFALADHFQQSIWELNDSVMRYGAYHDSNDWRHFGVSSTNLDRWIDEKRPILTSTKEQHILDLINTNYDFYLDAAREIGDRVRTNAQVAMRLGEFEEFDKQSRKVLGLGFRLAAAHRESMDTFLEGSKKSLNYLRFLLLTSLALLLLAGGGLAVAVYGGMIAPLRVKLVENEAIMERQEKLASLGMLAAGVAHEIRNPLTAIKAWLFVQSKKFKPGTTEQSEAEVIGAEISRLEGIVKDVLLLARPSDPHFVTISVDKPLREVQTLMEAQLRKADVKLNYENSVEAEVRIDPQQIKQVLINLVQNAADSIGHHGTITLRAFTGTKRLAERMTDVVVLEVADTGRGIAPEVEKRLFDPFFTTKETGTGLGLSIAARIVEKHGGALQYQTQVNRGTVFGIVLPRVPESSI